MLDSVHGGRNRIQPRGGEAGGEDDRREGAGGIAVGRNKALDGFDAEVRVDEVEGGEQSVVSRRVRRREGEGLGRSLPLSLPALC